MKTTFYVFIIFAILSFLTNGKGPAGLIPFLGLYLSGIVLFLQAMYLLVTRFLAKKNLNRTRVIVYGFILAILLPITLFFYYAQVTGW